MEMREVVMTSTALTFPFGQPVKCLRQEDRTPKPVFVLGVYASAVHARWVGADGKTRVSALAVASEPHIFWCGEAADAILARIEVPPEVGHLVPAQPRLNGPSGRSLDELFLEPLGLTRGDAWLCDIVPHSCCNPKQQKAIEREYLPLMGEHGLPEVSLPPVPKPLSDEVRRAEILAEIQESEAETIILLGDEPIRWFLRFHDDRWKKLADFGTTADEYGKKHAVRIAGREYEVLPLAHPRQASALGTHSDLWHELHGDWVRNESERGFREFIESIHFIDENGRPVESTLEPDDSPDPEGDREGG